MKTKPPHPARLRQPHQPEPRRRATDPLQRSVMERRLHPDFLALAFYPGMRNAPRTLTGGNAA